MKTYKQLLEEFDQYLNNAGDKFSWNPEDLVMHEDATVSESILEEHEEWLGTDKYDSPHPYSNQLSDSVNRTKTLHKHVPLNQYEQSSLGKYTASGYRGINSYHRTGNIDQSFSNIDKDEVLSHTKNIDSAIAKHTTEKSIHVWRGLHSGGATKMKLGKNKYVTDKGFVSTSVHPDVARHISRNWGTTTKTEHIAHIKIPAGSHAIHPLSHVGYAIAGENEVLLPRNSKFKYEGKDTHHHPDGFKTVVHHLTHIPSESNKGA